MFIGQFTADKIACLSSWHQFVFDVHSDHATSAELGQVNWKLFVSGTSNPIWGILSISPEFWESELADSSQDPVSDNYLSLKMYKGVRMIRLLSLSLKIFTFLKVISH